MSKKTIFKETNIYYRYFNNTAQQDTVEHLVHRITFLVPPWVRTLQISKYSEGESGAEASITTNCTYRHAEVYIYSAFFTQPSDQQLQVLIHEFLHMQHASVSDWTNANLVDPLEEKNPELFSYVENEYRRRHEEFIQDMSFVIADLVERKTRV